MTTPLDEVLDQIEEYLIRQDRHDFDPWAKRLLADLHAARGGERKTTAFGRAIDMMFDERTRASFFYARWVDALTDVAELRPVWAWIAAHVRDHRLDEYQNVVSLFLESERVLRSKRDGATCTACGDRLDRPEVAAIVLRDARARAATEEDAVARDRLDAAIRCVLPRVRGYCSERCAR
ncbi:MAG: hypothetical protein QUS11_06595 [Candidatus Fermentibacter sp.]|nr:hypothetical protein [Candidatus Fermentibacter sp.]